MKKNQPVSRPPQNTAGRSSTKASESRSDSRVTVSANGLAKKNAGKRRRKMPPKKKAMIIAASILGVIVILAGIVYAVVMGWLSNINTDPSDATIPSEYNPPTESLDNPLPEIDGIFNILLLGVDTRDSESVKERSDSMMILTVDQIHGKVKLTSLQRDMLVYIPGIDEPQKINSANSFGGPLLAMRVVNETLRLNITDYMVVNMRGMEQIIDLAGGVTLDILDEQIEYINDEVNYENGFFPDTEKSPLLTKAGRQLVNGRQAVAYARIRKLDSDYKRMERQRLVIQAMLNAFLKADLSTKSNMIAEGLSLITTNMTSEEILNVGINMVPKLSGDIDQLQIPIKGYFTEYSGSNWVNLCDFNGMIPILHEFIFGETYPFDPVKIIPGAPNSGTKLPTPTKKATATPAPTTVQTVTETLPPETSPETTAEPVTTTTVSTSAETTVASATVTDTAVTTTETAAPATAPTTVATP